MRTACPGVLQLFQNQNTAALAHHKAAAADIKGQAGSVRIGGGGKCLHAGKAADAQRADAAFGTAADHGSFVTVPDAVKGIAHSIGAAGAGRDRQVHIPFRPKRMATCAAAMLAMAMGTK